MNLQANKIRTKRWKKLLSMGFFSLGMWTYAQEFPKEMSVQEVMDLAVKNHPNLKVSRASIDIARQDVKVAKNNLLPDVTISAQAFHLSDVTMYDTDLKKLQKVDLPNFGNNFSIEAKQLLWKGGTVQNSIKAKSLQEEIAVLSQDANEQNIKLLVLGYYLDLYKIQNQTEVYRKNIELADKRLKNIQKFFNQGMITQNDLLRAELQLSNLNLAMQVLDNNRQILNKQLTVALGLDENTKITASDDIQAMKNKALLPNDYQIDTKKHPNIQIVNKAIELRETSLKITKAERLPALALFAGNSLQRPIVTSTPAMDLYRNNWNAGVVLTYNLESLFKAPKKISLGRYEIEKAKAQAEEAEQMIGVAVKAAYIKYEEAIFQNQTFQKNKALADENYRIMESRYNNQLIILLDMIDASNAKLDADLQLANSEINILFAYYKLLKESGIL